MSSFVPRPLTPLPIHNPHTGTRSKRDGGRRGSASSYCYRSRTCAVKPYTRQARGRAKPGNKDQPRDQGEEQGSARGTKSERDGNKATVFRVLPAAREPIALAAASDRHDPWPPGGDCFSHPSGAPAALACLWTGHGSHGKSGGQDRVDRVLVEFSTWTRKGAQLTYTCSSHSFSSSMHREDGCGRRLPLCTPGSSSTRAAKLIKVRARKGGISRKGRIVKGVARSRVLDRMPLPAVLKEGRRETAPSSTGGPEV